MKLSAEQIKLYKEIDEILWNDWDPIGVKRLAIGLVMNIEVMSRKFSV